MGHAVHSPFDAVLAAAHHPCVLTLLQQTYGSSHVRCRPATGAGHDRGGGAAGGGAPGAGQPLGRVPVEPAVSLLQHGCRSLSSPAAFCTPQRAAQAVRLAAVQRICCRHCCPVVLLRCLSRCQCILFLNPESRSSTGDLEVLEVLLTADAALPQLAAALAVGTPVADQLAADAAALAAAAAAAVARQPRPRAATAAAAAAGSGDELSSGGRRSRPRSPLVKTERARAASAPALLPLAAAAAADSQACLQPQE